MNIYSRSGKVLLSFVSKHLFKSIFLILLIINISSGAQAQLNHVAWAEVDAGAKIVGTYIDKKIQGPVRFVALGELQRNDGHKESIRLNTAIAAYTEGKAFC